MAARDSPAQRLLIPSNGSPGIEEMFHVEHSVVT
jgi:hypothetical protein